jgi:choline dehydrogenase-like flavoprotein
VSSHEFRLAKFSASTSMSARADAFRRLQVRTSCFGWIHRAKNTCNWKGVAIKIYRRSFLMDIQDFTDLSAAGHPMGACRMGNTAADSVVDSFGRCHEHPNLYIVGARVFPTAWTANPTLTLSALTLRTAQAVRSALATT